MNVSAQWDMGKARFGKIAANMLQCRGIFDARGGNADQLTAGFGQANALRNRCCDVLRRRRGH